MNIDKIGRELSWHPKEDLHSGLRKTVRWYLGNLDWVEAIAARPEYQAWLSRNYRARGEKA